MKAAFGLSSIILGLELDLALKFSTSVARVKTKIQKDFGATSYVCSATEENMVGFLFTLLTPYSEQGYFSLEGKSNEGASLD